MLIAIFFRNSNIARDRVCMFGRSVGTSSTSRYRGFLQGWPFLLPIRFFPRVRKLGVPWGSPRLTREQKGRNKNLPNLVQQGRRNQSWMYLVPRLNTVCMYGMFLPLSNGKETGKLIFARPIFTFTPLLLPSVDCAVSICVISNKLGNGNREHTYNEENSCCT